MLLNSEMKIKKIVFLGVLSLYIFARFISSKLHKHALIRVWVWAGACVRLVCECIYIFLNRKRDTKRPPRKFTMMSRYLLNNPIYAKWNPQLEIDCTHTQRANNNKSTARKEKNVVWKKKKLRTAPHLAHTERLRQKYWRRDVQTINSSSSRRRKLSVRKQAAAVQPCIISQWRIVFS